MAKNERPAFGLQEHQVFWSEQGEIACACCPIPFPGSDTWVFDRWEEITPAIAAEVDRVSGSVACHYCGREPSRLYRSQTTRGGN